MNDQNCATQIHRLLKERKKQTNKQANKFVGILADGNATIIWFAQIEWSVAAWWWWDSLLQGSLHQYLHLNQERCPKPLLCSICTIQMARLWHDYFSAYVTLGCWYTLNTYKTCLECLHCLLSYTTSSARKHFYCLFTAVLSMHNTPAAGMMYASLRGSSPRSLLSPPNVHIGPDAAGVDSGGIYRTGWHSHLTSSCNNQSNS